MTNNKTAVGHRQTPHTSPSRTATRKNENQQRQAMKDHRPTNTAANRKSPENPDQ
jgi:hypothetical protein